MAIVAATLLRLVLVWRSQAISVDGVQYVEAAQRLRAGEWTRALASFYPPGYPAAIAATYPLVHDWETAGVAVSLVAGVVTVLPLAAVARIAGLTGPAFAATVLGLALAPYPARYAAMVRSEALYALLVLVAVWLVVRPRAWPGVAGLAAGLAYLVRPEGLGLVLPLAVWLARKRAWSSVVALALGTALVAAPYVGYLRWDTGGWIVSRKAANVVSLGIHAATGKGEVVTQDASDRTGVVDVIRLRWGAYLRKVSIDLLRTVVTFTESLSPVLVPFLLLGLGILRRRVPAVGGLLGLVVGFYLVAFALLYVDRRFYAPLVPLALVWCGAGFGWAWGRSGRWAPALAAIVAALLIGKALHDREGAGYVRRVGSEIASRTGGASVVVAASDLRIPWYAGARRLDVAFPLDAAHVQPILDGGADWLVVFEGDLTADARVALAEHAGAVEAVATVPENDGRVVTLYRIRRSP